MLTGRRCGGSAGEVFARQAAIAPAVRRLEARDQPQQRGLAAAGRPEQREKLSRADVERNIAQRDNGAKAFRGVLDGE